MFLEITLELQTPLEAEAYLTERKLQKKQLKLEKLSMSREGT
jgi:hypothetical protein